MLLRATEDHGKRSADGDLNPRASPPGWAAQDEVLNHAEPWCVRLYMGMLIRLYRTAGRLSEVKHRAPAGAGLSIVPILLMLSKVCPEQGAGPSHGPVISRESASSLC